MMNLHKNIKDEGCSVTRKIRIFSTIICFSEKFPVAVKAGH